MNTWLTTQIRNWVRLARTPFVMLARLDAWLTLQLEKWPRSGSRKLRRAKPRKRRRHGPGWVSPKAMMAGIREQLTPAALALGWAPMDRRPGRKGERRFGEFEFERVTANRIERMGIDFQYGDKPDVFLRLALWIGEAGVCTSFQTGGCDDYWKMMRPLWRRLLDRTPRTPPPEDRLADALCKGLQRLHITEAYFRQGASHPDVGLAATRPPHRWPDGYADRTK